MTLLEWIKKNIVDGVDVSVAEKMIKDLEDLNPLNSVKTKDEALSFIERNQVFKSALDSETSKRVENALDKFKENKLPELVKAETEKIRLELNPKESDEQKRIRELEAKIQANEEKEKQLVFKQQLREKAKELSEKSGVPFDPLRAEDYSVFGDNAESKLQDEIDYIKKTIEAQLSQKLKGQYVGNPPSGGSATVGGIDEQIVAAKKAGNLNLASKLIVEKSLQQNIN